MRKWPPASRLLAGVALAFGLAAFLIVRAEAARVDALRPGVPMPVVEAASSIPAGTRLEPSMLQVVMVPSSFVPPGAFTSARQVAGRSLLSPIAAGEPLTQTRTGRIGGGPIASLVPAGLKAFGLQAMPAITRVVRPGDHVDVYATFTSGAPHTEAVLSAARVIAVYAGGGQSFSQGTDSAPELELLVDADQAGRLAYAQAFAKISIVIDGPGQVISPEPTPFATQSPA